MRESENRESQAASTHTDAAKDSSPPPREHVLGLGDMNPNPSLFPPYRMLCYCLGCFKDFFKKMITLIMCTRVSLCTCVCLHRSGGWQSLEGSVVSPGAGVIMISLMQAMGTKLRPSTESSLQVPFFIFFQTKSFYVVQAVWELTMYPGRPRIYHNLPASVSP